MQVIALDRLDIRTDRVRRAFDPAALEELAESIARNGLFHPPTVQYLKDAGTYQLVAGERRTRAIRMLHDAGRSFQCNGEEVAPGHLPCLYLGAAEDAAMLEAELEENFRRENLTWQERDEGLARLHALRAETNPKQTLTATADEARSLGLTAPRLNATFVRDSIQLTDHFDDPEIRDAATRDEALKRLRAKLLEELSGILAQRQRTRRADDRFQIRNEGFAVSPPSGVAVIVTDPPYGINAQAFGDQTSAATEHHYDDTGGEAWESLITSFLHTLPAAALPSAHLYLFFAIEQWTPLQRLFQDAAPEWKVWPRPIIWCKGNQGLLPDPSHGPRNTYDGILYARRGNRPTTGVYTDTITGCPQSGRLHRAAEKPAVLYENLLRRSANPGDLVWDPFGGTGPILRAAKELNLRAVMHEIDAAACDLALNLLTGARLP